MSITARIREFFGFRNEPEDLPGALIPSAVINRFHLLRDLPKVIGLDLRLLTADKLEPYDINIRDFLDGTRYSGLSMTYKNYVVAFESGLTPSDRPFYCVDIFCRNVDINYWRDICGRLRSIYGIPIAGYGEDNGKFTGTDYDVIHNKKNVSLKTWRNLRLEGYYLQNCYFVLRSYDHGKIANLHFYIYEE